MLVRKNVAKLGMMFAIGVSSSALAQSASAQADQAAAEVVKDVGISEIVVTAQRRAENLQNVPISITALSSDALTSSGIDGISSLQVAVPGLAFAQSAGYSLPRIRGVGTGANGPGVENSVAVYVDNVYIASTSAGTMSFNNIAQLAVLKGPQGTLFGRNATGGVIQITTFDPGQTAVLDASITAANRDTFQGNLYAAMPFTDSLAADMAVYYRDQNDGAGLNVNTGNDVGQGEDFAIRSKLKWEPSYNTTVKLSGDYAVSKGTRFASRAVPGTISAGSNVFLEPEFATQSSFDPSQRIMQKGMSLQVEQGIGDLSLVSITAYRRGSFFQRFDADTQPAPFTDVLIDQFDRQFTQELQLLSPKSGRLTWMIGFYYFDAESGYQPQQVIARRPPFLAPPTLITTTSEMTTKSLAGFGQATYAISDRTNFTAGVRYTSDQREGIIRRTIQLPNGVVLPAQSSSAEVTSDKLTWRLALDHRFSDQLLAYASMNRGFKSGLFDPVVIPLNTVAPEVLDAYEAGVKTDLLDRRLRINAAYFHYEYKNIQVVRISNGLPTLLSGPRAKIDGIDLDATAVIDSRLEITAGLSWLHARFTDFPQSAITTPLPTGGNALSFGDAAGNRLPMTPDWTLNLGATYEIPTRFGDFSLVSTWLHNDGYYEGSENRLRQRPFDIVNASINWTSPSGKYYGSVWGKNVFDEFYATQLSAQPTQDALLWGDPRTFGITVGIKL